MAAPLEGETKTVDQRNYSRFYTEDIGDIKVARKILEDYSNIPPNEVVPHIKTMRDKAWKVFQYPCVGSFRFLDFSISHQASYHEVLSRIRDHHNTLLDLGCCFGQDIRRLTSDGAPSENLCGADLRPEYFDLGYELFNDKEKLKCQFVAGDILDNEGEGGRNLKQIEGKFDIIHAASFLHLFTWDVQVQVGVQMVRFLKPSTKDSLILGRQVGSKEPAEYEGSRHQKRWLHDPDSFQKMWDLIGEKTGTRWKVKAHFVEDLDTVRKSRETREAGFMQFKVDQQD